MLQRIFSFKTRLKTRVHAARSTCAVATVLKPLVLGGDVMLIGYARISTPDQSLDLQKDALVKAGCRETFEDVASGAKAKRDGLDQALKYLRPGDTLIVWRLDRLGRSLRHLVDIV